MTSKEIEDGDPLFERRITVESILKKQRAKKSSIKSVDPAVVDVLTAVTFGIDDSIDAQGGKKYATNLQVLEDLGRTDARDPKTIYYAAVRALNELGLASPRHTPTLLNNFVENYFAISQNGAANMNGLNAIKQAPGKFNDIAAGRAYHTNSLRPGAINRK